MTIGRVRHYLGISRPVPRPPYGSTSRRRQSSPCLGYDEPRDRRAEQEPCFGPNWTGSVERPDDIPLLVWHFAKKFTQPVNKRIEFIPPEDREALALARSHWPGNLRSVVLSSDAVLHHPPLAERKYVGKNAQPKARTQAEAEREHILQALRDTGWGIGGPGG